MSRDYKVYIQDILEAISNIHEYTDGMTPESFESDKKTIDAVVRNLEIIGEAAKKIPKKICDEFSVVPWQRIGGLRDILIHEYFGIDLQIIWDVIQNKLVDLENISKQILAKAD